MLWKWEGSDCSWIPVLQLTPWVLPTAPLPLGPLVRIPHSKAVLLMSFLPQAAAVDFFSVLRPF